MNYSAGVLVVDKEAGPSSFEVVKKVRWLAGGIRTGHAGSLDPFATGVLVILLGKATKLSDRLLNADKRYRAVMKLGVRTDSMDCTGEVTENKSIPILTRDQVEAVLKSFEGEWNQTPPTFSAKKLHGVRLYELARQNIHVRLTKIPVQLYEMRLLGMDLPFIEFEVFCSKGTYIRSLADELGLRLGTVAHLHSLERTESGCFSLQESVKVGAIDPQDEKVWDLAYRNYIKLLRLPGMGAVNPEVHLPSRRDSANTASSGEKH